MRQVTDKLPIVNKYENTFIDAKQTLKWDDTYIFITQNVIHIISFLLVIHL